VAAIQSGYIDTVQCLIDFGVELDTSSADISPSAIEAAVQDGNVAILKLLINGGANVNHQTRFGGALFLAIGAGHEAIVRILLDAGADVNKESIYGLEPIARAVEGGHTEVVRILVQDGMDAKLGSVATALSQAARRGYTEIVRLLISAGVDVNHYEIHIGQHGTALQSAVMGSHAGIV
jgi:ankyrin repeat protein